ncbi:L,D-transpeptidase family protein [Rhizobium sp. FKY42]|uniref:L,D-transpeptidase family protein n=1 Tax=Rhizobium sp. FKY42 TaxID=2562310 RepID=UPI0010C02D30|nr:L,D-transpeptidase family protein [Rhizobium sp. FKY42]
MGGEKVNRKATIITVHHSPVSRSRAVVSLGNVKVAAAIGRSGRTSRKREGDGATPIADMKVLYGFLRGDRLKGVKTPLPTRRIAGNMLWCDEPGHPSYNRLVRAPFKPSHEEMSRKDGLYDICLVLDWNISSRARYRGSAIFFHLIRPGYEPTAGCIAVSLKDMRRILPYIRTGTRVRVF